MDAEGEDIALDDFGNAAAQGDDWAAETLFDDAVTPDVTPADPLTLSLDAQLKQTAIEDAYKSWGTPEGGINPNNFIYTEDNGLRLKNYPDISLINIRSKKGLAFSTIAGTRRGASAIREGLGFTDYTRKQKLTTAGVATLQKSSDDLGGISMEAENVEMQDLGAVAKKASEIAETTFSNAEIIGGEHDMPLREIRGLNKTLQTIRGELVNNLAKLSELDNHITREQNKLDEPDIGEFERQRITERIRNLKDERAPRLEAASASREALRSQISRIRETINRLINEDTTLAERIRTLFREQGITIVSILTALGMVISTLVLATVGSAATPPPAPSKGGGLREWVKKYLHALGRVLAKLAAKAGAALPGIIGSVVGWLLNLLSKTAGWLASNLWALMLAVGGILLIAAREWLAR